MWRSGALLAAKKPPTVCQLRKPVLSFNCQLRHRCNSGAAPRDARHAYLAAEDPLLRYHGGRVLYGTVGALVSGCRNLAALSQVRETLRALCICAEPRFPDLQSLEWTKRRRLEPASQQHHAAANSAAAAASSEQRSSALMPALQRAALLTPMAQFISTSVTLPHTLRWCQSVGATAP